MNITKMLEKIEALERRVDEQEKSLHGIWKELGESLSDVERRVAELEEWQDIMGRHGQTLKKDAPSTYAEGYAQGRFDEKHKNMDGKKDAPAVCKHSADGLNDCEFCKPEAKAVDDDKPLHQMLRDLDKPQPTTPLAEEQGVEEISNELLNEMSMMGHPLHEKLIHADVTRICHFIIKKLRSHNLLPKDKIGVDKRVAEEWLKHCRDFKHQSFHADLKNELRKAMEGR